MTKRQPKGEPEELVEHADRALPHNLEAERCVLGAILLHNDAHTDVMGILEPEDFYRRAHANIYAALHRLLERPGGSADIVTLKAELSAKGVLEDAGGPAYLSSLVDGMPRGMNVAHHAGLVKDAALLRAIIREANHAISDAYEAADPPLEILARTDQAIIRLQHGHRASRMARVQPEALLEYLEWHQAHRGQITGVPSGFPSIDGLTNGWQPGDMIVLAARPSMGKTTLLMNAIINGLSVPRADGSKRRAAVFSMEMRRKQLEMRMLSSLSKVPLSSILGGWVSTDTSWTAISQALGIMGDLDLHIDDSAGRRVQDIRAECRRLNADGGLDLVAIDYIQLMASSTVRRQPNRNEEITEISRSLKILADELSCPVIVLSQLRRTQGARPQLEDLRESGSLEQDADLVGFIHRKDHRQSGVSNFIVAKQRNGPTGTVNITLDRDTVTFTDGGEETPEQAATAAKEDDQARKTKHIIRQRAKHAGR